MWSLRKNFNKEIRRTGIFTDYKNIRNTLTAFYIVFELKYFEIESIYYHLFFNSFSECPISYVPIYGYLSTAEHYEGITVTLKCSPGYTLVGEANITCTSGIWRPKLGTCEQGMYTFNM